MTVVPWHSGNAGLTAVEEGSHAAADRPFATPLVWTATGGSVTSRGLYTAGTIGGTFHVVATDAAAGSDTATISVGQPAGGGQATGIPFGLFNVSPTDLYAPFNLAVVAGDPAHLLGQLESARKAGRKVIVNFAGGSYKRNFGADGTFSLDVWRSRVDRFRPLNLQPYIADGTLFANYLIDEPNDRRSWGGRAVSYEAIEQMAKYSKTLWPNLRTIVRTHVSWLAGAPFRWVYLDAGWSQYDARRGDFYRYRDAQVAAAQQTGLAVIFGLNVRDGGAVVDGCVPGGRPRTCAMSAAELERYGTALIAEPIACGLTLWQYEPAYLSRTDIQTSLAGLARLAALHPTNACR